MPRIRPTYWQYINDSCPLIFDPRIHITRQMSWLRVGEETNWTGVEPDNYNYAIFDSKPHDLKFIKDQCWYRTNEKFRKKKILGWMSVYVITDREEIFLFNREVLRLQPHAVWRYDKAYPVRPKNTILRREKQRGKHSENNLTTEERLYQMGYYEKLETKYFDDEVKLKVNLGTPRGIVQRPEPEVLDYDGF